MGTPRITTPPRAVVTRVAANTSLGDAATAAAAARARLARPAGLDARAFDDEEGSVPIVGHPVPTVSGFQGEARLLSLALPALQALVADAGFERSEQVGLMLAGPDLDVRARSAEADPPVKLPLMDCLVELSHLPAPPQCRHFHARGNAGFGYAVQAALQSLRERRLTACVVGGIDSLCDDLAVASLAAEGRLKTDDNPVGLQPGEAAAFLLLESPERAHRRGTTALAAVAGVGLSRERATGDDDPPRGKGILGAMQDLSRVTGPLPGGDVFFVLDRNGEVVRANDWGYVLQRFTAKTPELAAAPEWDPALSFGDTGAASGALATVMVARAFGRGYAPAHCAVVISASDGSERSALRVERAG